MLAGLFGLAAIVKSRAPQLPLWALMLSSQLIPLIFLILYALNIETYHRAEGAPGGYGQFVFSADYSYSLLGALIISILAAILALIPWGRRNGVIIGAVVFSNWIFAAIFHRGDVAILPGGTGGLPRVGLGLWAIPWVGLVVELALVLLGSFLYYHASMRAAVRAERAEARAGGTAGGSVAVASGGGTGSAYRQQALVATVALLVCLLVTLGLEYFLG